MGSREALRRGVLNLYNVDFAIEYPRPLPPSVKFIGPVMPHPPQKLPQDLLVRRTSFIEIPWDFVDLTLVLS
jgi:hypothetical protein